MALKKTGATSQTWTNPAALLFTLLIENSGSFTKDTTTYSIEKVLRDSTSFTQDDPTENEILDEFSSSPIAKNVLLGARNFTTTICDFQEDILVKILGFKKDSVSSKLYAPKGYVQRFAEITLVFGETKAITLPKVQLNSKMVLESLSTNTGQVTLAGTAFDHTVVDGSNNYECSVFLDSAFTMPT